MPYISEGEFRWHIGHPIILAEAAQSRLIKRSEIIPNPDDDSWNVFSGVPAPDYIPPKWAPEHVAKRLAEAFVTLSHLPLRNALRSYNAWPQYSYEQADVNAQVGDAQGFAQAQAEQNRTRIIPSSIEIEQMEAALSWPARYLDDNPQLLSAVGMVAVGRSRGSTLNHVAQYKLKLPSYVARMWNTTGLAMITLGLIRDGVAVY